VALNEAKSLTNKVSVNEADINPAQVPYIKVSTKPGLSYIFSTVVDNGIKKGELGFGKNARQWATKSAIIMSLLNSS